MEFQQVIARRESCRAYTDKIVTRESIEQILAEAQKSPSACNTQPWKFIVVDDPTTRKGLVTALTNGGVSNAFTKQVPAFIVIVNECQSLTERALQIMTKYNFVEVDTGIVAQSICLSAVDKGLSTCVIGAFNGEKVHELLHIPQKLSVKLVIAIGYAESVQLREKKRHLLSDVIRYNDYKAQL